LAEKLEFDAFPTLPEYEGIQSKFMKNDRDEPSRRPDKFESKRAEPMETSMLSDKSTPFKITGMGRVRDSTTSLANGTVNTINSINLEKINNRNEKRLMDIEQDYKFSGDDDELSKLGNSYLGISSKKDNDDYGNYAIKLDTNTNFMKGRELNSIQEENWEETFKKL